MTKVIEERRVILSFDDVALAAAAASVLSPTAVFLTAAAVIICVFAVGAVALPSSRARDFDPEPASQVAL